MSVDTKEFSEQAAWFAECLEAWVQEENLEHAFGSEVSVEAMGFAVRVKFGDAGELTMWKFKDGDGYPLSRDASAAMCTDALTELNEAAETD
jgi:hypothetical protein